MTATHKFELAGLGQAPYRLVGVRENVFINADGTTKGGGTCDYCSNGIRYEYHIESADGKTFKVGSDCVTKCDSSRSLIDPVKREVSRLKAAQRHKTEDAKINDLAEWFEASRDQANSLPHPYRNDLRGLFVGMSLSDYVDFALKNAGRSGKIHVLSLAKKSIESK